MESLIRKQVCLSEVYRQTRYYTAWWIFHWVHLKYFGSVVFISLSSHSWVEFFYLPSECIAVIFCCDWRMCSGLNCILFCWQTECIHPIGWSTLNPFIRLYLLKISVAVYPSGWPTLQSCSWRVGKHVEDITLVWIGQIFRSYKSFVFLPVFLPLLFDLVEIVVHFAVNLVVYNTNCKSAKIEKLCQKSLQRKFI